MMLKSLIYAKLALSASRSTSIIAGDFSVNSEVYTLVIKLT